MLLNKIILYLDDCLLFIRPKKQIAYRVNYYSVVIVFFVLSLGSLDAFADTQCNLSIISKGEVKPEFDSLGKIKAGAHSLTTICMKKPVMHVLKQKACQKNARYLVIEKIKEPGAWRSCYTISGRIYGASEIGLDYSLTQLQSLAEKGDPSAQYELGMKYLYGKGVNQDLIKSYAWFNIAASVSLNKAKSERDLLETLMSIDDINRAQTLSHDIWVSYYKVFDGVKRVK